MDLSVVIPAYNASATIGRVLEALALQDFSGGFEVIVVDDGSTDQTAAAVKNFPHVRYERQDNAGPASARNRGAGLAAGRYLAFTDSDCIPHRDWLSLLRAGFSRPVSVVAGSYGIANPESRLARGIHREILFRHARLMPEHPRSFGSYNFCVTKEAFGAVGGFQTAYRQASGEDNDLAYKILKSGGRIYFERRALVDHYHTVRVGKYLREQFRHGFWRARMCLDHPGLAAGDDYTFWKDTLEVPLCLLCVFVCFLFPLFLLFEIFFAWRMGLEFLDGIFFGFVMLARAFARTLGLSTGILNFCRKRSRKKVK